MSVTYYLESWNKKTKAWEFCKPILGASDKVANIKASRYVDIRRKIEAIAEQNQVSADEGN